MYITILFKVNATIWQVAGVMEGALDGEKKIAERRGYTPCSKCGG